MTPILRITTAAVLSLTVAHCGATVRPEADASPSSDASTDGPGPLDVIESWDVTPITDATPIPGHCFTLDPTNVIAPQVLMEGQTLGVTMTSIGMAMSCGATPLLGGNPDALTWNLSACGGCEACNCIDQGYEISTQVAGPAAGNYTIHVGSQMRPLIVAPVSSCFEMTTFPTGAVSVEIVGPNRSLRQGDPQLWWAHVTASETRCCGDAHVASTVSAIRPAGADLGVALYECNPDPCDCVGAPRSIEAWVNLGELPAGSHGLVVSGGSTTVTFDVPPRS